MDLIGLVLVAGIIYLIVRLTRRGGLRMPRRGGRRFKCHDCRHCRRLFDDGVMCGYGNREVFKNARHIAMCGDWSPRS
jgi:hypothetical protein